ncbi:ParB N-terminal domain-containing protein [Streptosporangium sp. NPDC006013]|uniref:ParB N-terminal domain-containing protein n=1 Tax=Streptosporangium sp. NPDC006013 TaxID=3155596 RepID=UPI0033B8A712
MRRKVLDEDCQPSLSVVETVSVHELLPADSPRAIGEDHQHVRLLSELDGELPPIVVHRSTMRVVDGMHRLRAAALRGEETIRVQFFEGVERDAFVIAVKENVSHGLPLSAADRSAAAGRIVRSHPHWSDRAIARVAGLSARTVNAIRRATFPESAQLKTRVGCDGRIRPLDSSAGRIHAAELMTEDPQASLRQIAQQSGISPNTVRDVRDRLRREEDPLPNSRRSAGASPGPAPRKQQDTSNTLPPGIAPERRQPPHLLPEPKHDRSRTSSLNALIKDPSLRSGERGRLLLRMLSVSASLVPSWEQLIDAVPEHCIGLVCQAAEESAAAWTEFAEDLGRRAV